MRSSIHGGAWARAVVTVAVGTAGCVRPCVRAGWAAAANATACKRDCHRGVCGPSSWLRIGEVLNGALQGSNGRPDFSVGRLSSGVPFSAVP